MGNTDCGYQPLRKNRTYQACTGQESPRNGQCLRGEVIMMWGIRKRLLASVCSLMPGILGPLLAMFPLDSASAQDQNSWVTSCRPGSELHREAQAYFNTLEAKMQAYSETLNLQSLRSVYFNLVRGPCFEIAQPGLYRTPTIQFFTAFAWWVWGEEWLRTTLNPP